FQDPPSWPDPEWARTKSARSASIATNPRPPSSSGMFSFGKRTGMPDHSQSAHATRAFTGNSVVMVSNGVSGAGIGAHCAEPVCRQMKWLDDVIVNRDQDVLSRPGRRIGQQRHT